MRSWSIPAGRLLGAEVRIHLSFLFLLFFVLMTEAVPTADVKTLGRGLLLVLLVLASVLVHEVAHIIAGAKLGVPVRTVLLLPIGGVRFGEEAGLPGKTPSASREIPVALAGSVLSLVLAFLAAAVTLAVAPQVPLWTRPLLHSATLLRSLVWINLYLAALNLLPAYPLDGGQMLRALLCRRMDYVRATRVAVFVGQVFAMIFMLMGGVWNYWLTMAGLFLFFAVQIEERSLLFQSVLETVRMEDVMLTDFSTLSPADTLEDALSKAVHSLQDDFPVVRDNDMVGVVTRQKIVEALRDDGNAYVQSVMNRAFEVGQRHESLASAFRKLTSRGLTLIPVVDQERLVGIVTLQNLMHSMALLAESRTLRKE
ncbi:MAG: site-2 protease family protein [Terriglobales bacterium]